MLDPVDFLRKLAALVPPRRQNQVRFYGLLAPQAHDRERFERLMPVPPGRDDATDPNGTRTNDTGTSTETEHTAGAYRATSRQSWATLLRRVFQIDTAASHPLGDHRARSHRQAKTRRDFFDLANDVNKVRSGKHTGSTSVALLKDANAFLLRYQTLYRPRCSDTETHNFDSDATMLREWIAEIESRH